MPEHAIAAISLARRGTYGSRARRPATLQKSCAQIPCAPAEIYHAEAPQCFHAGRNNYPQSSSRRRTLLAQCRSPQRHRITTMALPAHRQESFAGCRCALSSTWFHPHPSCSQIMDSTWSESEDAAPAAASRYSSLQVQLPVRLQRREVFARVTSQPKMAAARMMPVESSM